MNLTICLSSLIGLMKGSVVVKRRLEINCPVCRGKGGWEIGEKFVKCAVCRGSGRLPRPRKGESCTTDSEE